MFGFIYLLSTLLAAYIAYKLFRLVRSGTDGYLQARDDRISFDQFQVMDAEIDELLSKAGKQIQTVSTTEAA